MSRKVTAVLLGAALIVIAACAVNAFLITRAAPESSLHNTQVTAQQRVRRGPRNLFLQPEALRVSRLLGKRFDRSSRAITTTVGSLTLAGNQQPLTLVRRQTESGEDVELALGGRGLTWTDNDGIKARSGVVTDIERLLVERLLLDSPDQFVLAQLRGASYFTVARNVRPTDASDGYSGALWNLVRVDEPQTDENLRPLSSWRIYYINVQSGLPDRIEYQLYGQEITADFLAWREAEGERTPSHITWSSGGETVMEYQVTNVSHNQ
ncbi:MAG: hypothetical protein LC794_15710 [Acidobacteria bacterium]|nr:hypothetical protein [Acidobacteriota bacterium]